MDIDTSFIGTGIQKLSKNLSEVNEAMKADKAECGGGLTVKQSWFINTLLSADTCVIYGELMICSKSDTIDELHNQIAPRFGSPQGNYASGYRYYI